MYDRRRIQISKWTVVVFGIIFLSQAIARWRAFFAGPTVLTYVAIITAGTIFILLLTALAIVVYAEEKTKGTLQLHRPWLDALADRFFMIHSDSTKTIRGRAKITCAVQVILLQPLMSARYRIGQFILSQRPRG